MSRKLKMKRQIIEEANRRLLGEQNEKLSDYYINNMIKNVQGIYAHVVKPGETISSIIKNSENDGVYFLPFDPELNSHIKDPNVIYPEDVIFFMSDTTSM